MEAKNIEYENLYYKLKEVTNRLDEITQDTNNLKQQIEDLMPWNDLDVEISDISDGEDTKIFAGTIPLKQLEETKIELSKLKYTHLQEVSQDKAFEYVVVMTVNDEYNATIETLRKNGFNKIDIEGQKKASEEISKHENSISNLDKEKVDLEKQLDHYTVHLGKLELAYEYMMNQRLKLTASEKFARLSDVNITQGYVPTDMVENFKKVLSDTLGNRYYVEIKEAERDDPNIPILLKNNKFNEVFESITTMYALPKYNEIDPTPFFAIFYWVFFGMMVADVGYGVLVLIGTTIALKAFNLKPNLRKFVGFFFFLSISTIVWGLVYGSAFGMSLPFKLIDTQNEAIRLLMISVIFGGVHLFYAMAIQAYMKIRDGKPMDAVYDVLFWYMALMGAIVFLIGSMVPSVPSSVGNIAKWVMIIGMVGIVLFGARDSKSPVGRLVGGLYELYGISSYVGDFVSYSRLMALGLAGGFIAVAINMIIGMLPKNIIGIAIGLVVFVFGHLFNAFLSLLSAYVHTSRLTYVEFFGKFYEGGGKAFNLFKNDAKYINIK
ncbi:V-type ATP synthase subunit I [Microaceticoccus formicicus]|uniref:V-type ATP synthase subunit I n=1 Tax=Microaceticoccus formicicus TaxID=3118105 RepID=UPI003CD00985|nr:V-type ATP synthase subunit I [Peptoniphilaceae bacterium AMB_02]